MENIKKKAVALIKNARFPQLIYHGGLLAIGAGLEMLRSGKIPEISFYNLMAFSFVMAAVVSAWLASVILNDLKDVRIDAISNSDRPLIKKIFSAKEYSAVGWFFFAGSIILSAIINFKITLLLLIYQAIAFAYSSPPLRLKKFPFISTFTASIASLMVLFSGFILFAPQENIKNFPVNIILLLIIGYTLSLPIKDFKDIEGDKKDGVFTIPVIFGEQWGKIVVGGGIFLSFLLSVLFFNEPRLFWWAVIFGGISFWIISQMSENKKIHPVKSAESGPVSREFNRVNYRNIFWWIMGTVIIYGIILVKIVFLEMLTR